MQLAINCIVCQIYIIANTLITHFSGTSVYGHLTSKVTFPVRSPLLSPKIGFRSAKNRTFSPRNTITSPLRSLLISHMGDLNSEVPLYMS